MIAFGVCIGPDEANYRSRALPGIARAAEPDSVLLESRDNDSIFNAYNQILDHVTGLEGIEGLVLLHDDVELREDDLGGILRTRFADPEVAVVGVIGACGVGSLAWWEYETRGVCEETRGRIDFGAGLHDVDTVDGLLMALSPWAIRNLRFDADNYHGFHGYDADFCAQARAAGRRVVVDSIDLFHHTKGGYGDTLSYQTADVTYRRKWCGAGISS